MISALALTGTFLCVLIVGMLLGALMLYRVMVGHVASNPSLFGSTVAAALSSLAYKCNRSHLHVFTDEGMPVAVPVESFAHSLQTEVTAWMEQKRRGLS